MFNIILFGPPGSGKGTQSDKLIKKYGFKHLSTGGMIRSEIDRQTPLGKKVEKIVANGELLPDEIVIELIYNEIKENTQVTGFLFDGFPRTIEQAKALDEMLSAQNSSINLLLALDVPEEESINRLMDRYKTSRRLDDLYEHIQRNRLLLYNNETLPVLDHYLEKSQSINGLGLVQEIFTNICDAIDKKI